MKNYVTYFAVSLVFALPAFCVDYELIDLGNLDDLNIDYGQSINENSQIVGYARSSYEHKQLAYYWDSSSGMSEIGSAYPETSYAGSINNQGYVTGGYAGNAYIWHADTGFTFLEDNGKHSSGADINENNNVVGTFYIQRPHSSRFVYEGALWKNGSLTMLDNESEYHSAMPRAINNSNKIVGRIQFTYWGHPSYSNKAVLWNEDGSYTYLSNNPDDLSLANDINDNNIIAGSSHHNEVLSACYWDENFDIHYLGFLEEGYYSEAEAINNSGQIVGTARAGKDYFDQHGLNYQSTDNYLAFLWDEELGMIDLNAFLPEESNFEYLAFAKDINDKGEITGYGYIDNGYGFFDKHAFLLTPIPEPSSLLFLFIGTLKLRKRELKLFCL